MNYSILLKFGEITLKGANRAYFENTLLRQVRYRIKPYGKYNVFKSQSTICVEAAEDGCDMDAVYETCKKIFGIVAIDRACVCEKDMDVIYEALTGYLDAALREARSFKVEAKRADKRFPLNSIQIMQDIGGRIDDAYDNLRVDVHEPELVVNVKIRDLAAYVHAGGEPGAGGLPVGTCGRAVTLLSGGIDSPVSTWMIARRGVEVIPVHFFSPPYTSEAARRKVLELARLLLPWCGKLMVEIVPFTEIQEQIRLKCPEEYFTLIMRRCMMSVKVPRLKPSPSP